MGEVGGGGGRQTKGKTRTGRDRRDGQRERQEWKNMKHAHYA